MTPQSWIVLAVTALAALYFGRKLRLNLADHGRRSDCGCGEGGACCARPRRGDPAP